MESRGPIWDVVAPYVQRLKRSGSDNAMGLCPFHDETNPSFAINLKSGLWICHSGSCGKTGNLRTFLRLLGRSGFEIDEVMQPLRPQIESYRARITRKEEDRFYSDPYLGEHILPEEILAPYDSCPNYMIRRGFDPDLLQEFEVGYDVGKERVTFPIRDLYGNLVGVSGRSVVGASPRFKVYKRGYNVDGEWFTGDFGPNFDDDKRFTEYDINVGRYMWNANRAVRSAMLSKDTESPLIVVEGYKACLWVVQCGFRWCVAIMGSRIRNHQIDILARVGNPIVIFLDNNEAGRMGTDNVARAVRQFNNRVSRVNYPSWADHTIQPDDLSEPAVGRVIGDAERWPWQIYSGSS